MLRVDGKNSREKYKNVFTHTQSRLQKVYSIIYTARRVITVCRHYYGQNEERIVRPVCVNGGNNLYARGVLEFNLNSYYNYCTIIVRSQN